jgi:hypothetical protein
VMFRSMLVMFGRLFVMLMMSAAFFFIVGHGSCLFIGMGRGVARGAEASTRLKRMVSFVVVVPGERSVRVFVT